MEHQFTNCAIGENAMEAMAMLEHLGASANGHTAEMMTKYPLVKTDTACEVADVLVSLVRLNKTNECYDTHGGVDENDILVDASREWKMKLWYKQLLHSLLDKRACDVNEAIITEQSFRMKKGKGYKWVFFVCRGTQKGLVFDVTSRANDYESHVPVVFSPLPTCGRCASPAKFVCNRCKTIHYCCRNCQKLDWPKHKQDCSVVEKQ